MTDMLDPVELLNSLAPPPGWNERVDLETDAQAATIFNRVVTGNVIPFRAPRRRLRIATGVVVTLALGGVGVAALLQRSAEEDRTLSCWSEAAADPAATVAQAWDGTTDPTVICAGPWSDGTFDTGNPPPLQACVTNRGVVVVMPGGGPRCESFTMSPYAAPDPDAGDLLPSDADDDAAALDQLLKRRYNADSCFTEQEATIGVRRTLEEFGFDGWATQTGGTFSATEKCASTAVERETETVYIVPLLDSAEASN